MADQDFVAKQSERRGRGTSTEVSSLPLLRPIERINVNSEIVHRLKAFLDHGHLKMGSRLPSERQLAVMLKVSRHSVREVLRAFTMLGILRPKQGKGTYVVSAAHRLFDRPEQILTFQERLDLVELAEARSAIEPFVAALTAERSSNQDLAAIREHLDAMRSNLNRRQEFMRHDLQFHLAIAKACGNPTLTRMMSMLLEPIFRHAERLVQNPGRVLALHEAVFDAIQHRAKRQATNAMLRHMAVTKRDSATLMLQPPTGKRRASDESEGENFPRSNIHTS